MEDVASACRLASVNTGVALMGTNLLPEHVDVVRNYEYVGVALDKDATDKAIEIVRQLAGQSLHHSSLYYQRQLLAEGQVLN